MTYYNTTSATGETLDVYRKKAASQEAKILAYFMQQPRLKRSPSQVRRECFAGTMVPITSVRRALTNLTRSGDLIRTALTVEGCFGRPESLWALAIKHQQGDLFR